MPDIRDLADIETILVTALEADVDLAELAEGRISTRLPSDFAPEARVRIFRAGGTPVDPDTGHIDRALIQLEGYGETDTEAFDVTARAITALMLLAGTTQAGAVITAVHRVSGPTWRPDPPTDIAGYLTQMVIYAHPTSG